LALVYRSSRFLPDENTLGGAYPAILQKSQSSAVKTKKKRYQSNQACYNRSTTQPLNNPVALAQKTRIYVFYFVYFI